MIIIDTDKTAKVIKDKIKQTGIKNDDLSEMICVSVPGIYKWFQGRSLPTIDNLVKIADICGCTINDLIVVEEVVDVRL